MSPCAASGCLCCGAGRPVERGTAAAGILHTFGTTRNAAKGSIFARGASAGGEGDAAAAVCESRAGPRVGPSVRFLAVAFRNNRDVTGCCGEERENPSARKPQRRPIAGHRADCPLADHALALQSRAVPTTQGALPARAGCVALLRGRSAAALGCVDRAPANVVLADADDDRVQFRR